MTELADWIGKYESRNDWGAVAGENPDPDIPQRTIADNYSKYGDDTAIGYYQIKGPTAIWAAKKAGMDPKTTVFDQDTQDVLFERLLNRRGALDPNITPEEFLHNLSQEWAFLPSDNRGLSYYHNDGRNKALVPYDEALKNVTTYMSPDPKLDNFLVEQNNYEPSPRSELRPGLGDM